MTTKNPSPARLVNKFKEHARFVIKHHFGSPPSRIAHKSAGLTNFVFAAKHKDGEFIIRISPDRAAINSFIKEQWAQNEARKAGVPTAEILEVGSAIIPHPYMVTRSVVGMEATHHPDREKIVGDMGRFAALIHGIRTRGFGETFDWSNNQLSRNETWKDYLENEYRYESKLESLENQRMLAPEQSKKLRKLFAEAVKMKPRAVLNHGDMRLKNVIADENGKVTAIIDWENCTSNLAPHWDLSLALHDLGIDEMQRFLIEYGINDKKLREVMPLIKAFNITNYASAIDEIVRSGDKKRLEQYRTRLSGALDLYSF
jgi:hygromycin-B 4-O-kinase